MDISGHLNYTGKAEVVVRKLDSIILKNDEIENAQIKREYLLHDGSGSSDDMGLGNIIKSCEEKQQNLAEEIAHIDKRGTVRTRIASDCVNSLCVVDRADKSHDRLKNYLITLALLSLYRLRVKNQSTLVKGMLGALPTTGRDYSEFRRSWRELYGNSNERG